MAPVDDAAPDELTRLRAEVLELRQKTAQLQGRTYVLKEGVLSRFREKMMSSGWRERHYELRVQSNGTRHLTCFTMQRTLRMTLSLSEKCVVLRESEDSGGSTGGPLHCFQVTAPSGAGPATTIRLSASTATEADAWVKALQQACFGGSDRLDESSSPSARQIPRGPPAMEKRDTSVLFVIHRVQRASLLTSEDPSGPQASTVGIMNLSVCVLVAMNFRLIVENFMKYGVLIDFTRISDALMNYDHLQCVICGILMPLLILVTFVIEVFAAQGVMSEFLAQSMHGFNCTLCLAIPIAVIRQTVASPGVGALLLLFGTTLFLKLVSYAHVNTQLRQRRSRATSKGMKRVMSETFQPDPTGALEYPDNLTPRNILLFMFFPTLIYQLTYPRTSRIRKLWLFKRVCELIICFSVMFVIMEQFVAPTLRNAKTPILDLDFPRLLERLLKLAVPNVYLWLCMFYGVFHLWMNILAEVTYFGDRLFYKEWWNATKLEDYWRLWNLPVHNWLLKHVFFPLISMGCSKLTALVAVFIFSAAFHELLVSVPCHVFRFWAFLGMMAQLPLVWITGLIDERLKGSRIGNVIFWISFCIVGQPLCVLLYFADFLNK